VLLTNQVSASQLVAYINEVKAAVPGVPVTTADTFDKLLANPSVLAAVDVVYANYYPYWSAGGIPINDAIGFTYDKHQQVIAASGGKPVVMSEVGWPDAGSGTATTANAAQHLREFLSFARATGTEYLYFEAFDELWKDEGGVGSHWGAWNRDGTAKTWPAPMLAGEMSGDEVIAGPGTPLVEFSSYPAIGIDGVLRGYVQHVVPNDARIACYIRVGGSWWMKPFQTAPLTWVRGDGTWMCDIVTHPNDLNATDLAAYLLPDWYDPPDVLGLPSIPSEIVSTALASKQIAR